MFKLGISYDVNDHVYSKVKIHLTLYGFCQYRSNVDFDIDVLMLILTWTFNYLRS